MGAVVGRDSELDEITAFLAGTEGRPSVLLLEGEAGIGKSTVWIEGTVAAGDLGYRVLTSRPVEVETRISFATVGDLLGDVLDEVAAELPSPQRRALEVALLLREPEGLPPTSQAVAFAFLSALLALSRSRPVLVAVDDIQWLDRPSATMLTYAVRRVADHPIRMLLSQRTGDAGLKEFALSNAIDKSRLERVSLGPLSAGAMQRMFREELGEGLTRPLFRRVFGASGGNPFYALELARALARGDGRVELGEPLLVPESVRALVAARLTALPDKTERALESSHSSRSRPSTSWPPSSTNSPTCDRRSMRVSSRSTPAGSPSPTRCSPPPWSQGSSRPTAPTSTAASRASSPTLSSGRGTSLSPRTGRTRRSPPSSMKQQDEHVHMVPRRSRRSCSNERSR